MYIIYSTYLNL